MGRCLRRAPSSYTELSADYIDYTDGIRLEPQSGEQITLHYEDALAMAQVSRIKH